MKRIGRPRLNPQCRQIAFIGVRLTEKEHENFTRQAKTFGMNVSSYLRMKLKIK